MTTLGTLARGFFRLARHRLMNRRFPLNVFFAVTNRCNLSCYYCYGEYFKRGSWPELTTAEITDTLTQLRSMGTLFVQLQGGEPLLRDDIGTLVETSKRLGFNTDMITNGILVERTIDEIRDLDSICISIDGRKDLQERNRGAGTFEKVLGAIDCCRAAGIPVRLNAMLTGETEAEDVTFLLDTAREKGCMVNFCPTFRYLPLDGEIDPRQFVDDATMRQLLDIIIRAKEEGFPVQFSARAHRIAAAWPLPYATARAPRDELPADYSGPACRHGDYVCFIDADGRLYPCCNFWNDYPEITIRDSGFAAAWERLSRQGCAGCFVFSYIDRNMLLGLKPAVLLNYLANAWRNAR